MNCDHCDKPAVVHEIVIKGGDSKEVHLCSDHAIAAGYPLPVEQPLADIFPKLGSVAKVEAAKSKERSAKCAACGLTFTVFRKSATLGCPACYDAFMPIICANHGQECSVSLAAWIPTKPPPPSM